MSAQYILLWLEAPLQAWGADSKFGRRDSLRFPTKSGVAGLMLSALGASGEQRELLETLAPLKQTVISYARRKGGKKKEPEPLLIDFHMVGAGYDDSNPWEKLLIPKTSEGKKAVGGGTKMTYRYYLQDARFAVIIEVPDSLVIALTEAIRNPVYDLYLGRKNCVPTEFIYQGVFGDEQAALEKAGQIADEKGDFIEDFRVIDGERGDKGEVMTLNDIPVQFGAFKKYKDRRVTVIPA
jgi:CRISPR system Cascade subunit CasD